MAYAVHAVLSISARGIITSEVSLDGATLDEALERIRQLARARPDFRSATLLHREDLPAMLACAEQVPGEWPR